MKKSLRLLVLSGVLALMASPVFADGGPGSVTPPSGGGNGGGSGTTNSSMTTSSATATTLATLLAYLGL